MEEGTMVIKRTITKDRELDVSRKHFKIGDILCFELNDGEKVEALAVKQETDGTVFILVDCLKDEYPMNRENTTKGGYDACRLRKVLNSTIIDRFPLEVREHMVKIYQDDYLTIPAKADLFGDECWEPMKQRKNRIAFQGSGTDVWEWYWLRDVVSATHFAIVNDTGCATYYSASSGCGIRPAFKITNL